VDSGEGLDERQTTVKLGDTQDESPTFHLAVVQANTKFHFCFGIPGTGFVISDGLLAESLFLKIPFDFILKF
jgi:hypothetical protein